MVVRVGRRQHRIPRSEVRPDKLDGQNRAVFGLLHHGAVEGGPRCLGESLAEANDVSAAGGRRHRLGRGLRDRPRPEPHLPHQRRGRGDEGPAVPQRAGLDQPRRRLRIGLFLEAGDRSDETLAGTWANIAVGRGRRRRTNPEHDDRAFRRPAQGRLNRGAEGRRVGDVMIGGEDRDDRRRVDPRDPLGGGGDRGGGVPGRGLQQHLRRCPDGGQLVPDQSGVGLAANHDQRAALRQGRHTQRGGLETGQVADEGQERLRPRRPRCRPQPIAGSAAKDHGIDGRGDGRLLRPARRAKRLPLKPSRRIANASQAARRPPACRAAARRRPRGFIDAQVPK